MFVVKALHDLDITSLDINTMFRAMGAVRVYTRTGSYNGHESNSNGWELVYDNPLTQMNGRGRATKLEKFDKVVTLSSGQYQSFYVWAEQKLVYKRGSVEGRPFVSDDNLVIYEGIGLKGHFGEVRYSPRVWSGVITYRIPSLLSSVVELV